MKFVSKINKKREKEDSLLYHLHRTLAGYERARTTKRVHASELYSDFREFCPREVALLDILKKRRPDEFISTATRSTFDFGDMYADWLIDKLADAKLAIGDWECRYCGEMYKFQTRPRTCRECDHHEFKHHEHRFKSKTCGVSCGVDTIRKTKGTKHRAIEIKSILKGEFEKLEGPLHEHKIRTNLYMRIIDDSKDPARKVIDTQTAEIIYICKGGYKRNDDVTKWGFQDDNFSPFKVFLVKREDEKTQEKWDHALRLKEFREGKKGVPLGLCATQWTERAEKCSVCSDCFSGKYPGEQ